MSDRIFKIIGWSKDSKWVGVALEIGLGIVTGHVMYYMLTNYFYRSRHGLNVFSITDNGHLYGYRFGDSKSGDWDQAFVIAHSHCSRINADYTRILHFTGNTYKLCLTIGEFTRSLINAECKDDRKNNYTPFRNIRSMLRDEILGMCDLEKRPTDGQLEKIYGLRVKTSGRSDADRVFPREFYEADPSRYNPETAIKLEDLHYFLHTIVKIR